jgi:hypothetical protein
MRHYRNPAGGGRLPAKFNAQVTVDGRQRAEQVPAIQFHQSSFF